MGTLEYPFTLRALTEAAPGPGWAALFAERRPGYRRWYLDGPRSTSCPRASPPAAVKG